MYSFYINDRRRKPVTSKKEEYILSETATESNKTTTDIRIYDYRYISKQKVIIQQKLNWVMRYDKP